MDTLHLEASDLNAGAEKNEPNGSLRRSPRVTSRAKSTSLATNNSNHEDSSSFTSSDSESINEAVLLKKMQSKLMKHKLKKKKLKASLDPRLLKALNKLLLKAKAKEAIKKLKLKHESELARYKFMVKLVKNAILHYEKSKNQNHDHSNSIELDDSSDEMDESSLRKALDSVGGLNGLLEALKDAQKDLISQFSGQSGSKSTPKKKCVPRKSDSASFASNYGVIPDFFHMDFTGKKGLPDKCGLCGLEFPSDYMLVHHVKYRCATEADILGQTDIPGNFSCSSCDMIFVSKLRLMVHEVRKHSDSGRKYKCDQCEKSYKKCDTLIWHRRQAHMSLRMFKCDQCGNEFCYKSALDRHLKIHKGIKYTCTECNISYDSHSSYEYHMRKHKGLSYMCEVCGLRSWERRRIRKHYETNHPDHQMTENALTLKPGADGSAAIADAASKRSKLLQEKGGQLTDGSYVGAGTSRPRKPTRGRNVIKNNTSEINEQLDDSNCATNASTVKRSPEKRNLIQRSSSGSTNETVAPLDLDGLEYTTYEFTHDSVTPTTIEIVSDSSLHPLNSTLASQTIYNPSTSRQMSNVPTTNYFATSNGIHFAPGQLATVQMPISSGASSNSFHVSQNVQNVTYATSQCKLCHELVSDLQTHYSSFHKLAPDVTVLFC